MANRKRANGTLGIDIGGTKIRAVLWTSSAGLDGRRAIKALEFRTPQTLRAFKKIIISIFKDFEAKKNGIGVPCVISGNKILFCPNIKYLKNYDISKLFKNSKIKLDNDARCFARAECSKSASCLAITLGTGVGRAFAKNGKVLKIKKFEYPEKWEADYQRLRDAKNDKKLSDFLTTKISILIKKYKPGVVVIGGGVVARKTLKLGFAYKKPFFSKNAVAIGAALLFSTPH